MPTYEYECDACGERFEKFQSMSAALVRTCPACGKRKVRRLIGAGAGILFKGSGFYQTDYRSESYKKAAEKDKPAVPAASGESKGESKTASAAGGAAATSSKSGGSDSGGKRKAE